MRRRVVGGGVAWTGVSGPAPCMRVGEPPRASLAAAASPSVRVRADADAMERGGTTLAGSTDEPIHAYSSTKARRMRVCDWCATPDACAQARWMLLSMRARVACACGASGHAQPFQRRQRVEGARRYRRDLVVVEIPACAKRGGEASSEARVRADADAMERGGATLNPIDRRSDTYIRQQHRDARCMRACG